MNINCPLFRICHSSTVIASHFRNLFTLRMPRYKNTFEVRKSYTIFYLSITGKSLITVVISYFCWGLLRAGSLSHFEAKTKMTGEESAGNH